MSSRPIITLLTDFGNADYFAGSMKGVILGINPEANIVDITHDVPAQDVHTAAFILLAAFRAFPPGTVHVAVVDPGVGSERRPLAAIAENHFFVGPDNGVFSYVFERDPKKRVFNLTKDAYFRKPVSETFHGRDIFAPVGGALSRGIPIQMLGEEISDYVLLPSLRSVPRDERTITATIIHVDRFGNCVTNIALEQVSDPSFEHGIHIRVCGHEIKRFQRFFAEDQSEDVFALWGSAGLLELAAFRKRASDLLNAKRGDEVLVLLEP